jgi:hypothetical protein
MNRAASRRERRLSGQMPAEALEVKEKRGFGERYWVTMACSGEAVGRAAGTEQGPAGDRFGVERRGTFI